MIQAIEKAAMLIEALSYIQKFRDKIVIVKVGGSFIEAEESRRSVLADIVFMRTVGIQPIVIHGGGPAISKAMKDRNLQPKWVNGLRYTDAETLEIATDVLTNHINKQLVDEIRSLGGQAEAVHPRSRPVLKAERDYGVGPDGQALDLGFVGKVVGVDTWVVQHLLREGIIPVIAPLALDEKFQVYNVNADTAASRIAVAVKAEKLVNMSDTHGIRLEPEDATSLASSLRESEIQNLIAAGKISGGMIPKVECCLTAVAGGVAKCHIIDGRIKHSLLLEIYTDKGVGTEILR